MTVGADGERVTHPLDVIIFGTGFHVSDGPLPKQVFGKDGRTLGERWADDGGMSALHGTTVAGFPNMFLLVGPNTGLGHSSIIYIIESQLTYLLDALHAMEDRPGDHHRAAGGGAAGVQHGDSAPAGRNRLEQGRMRQLVSG